MGRLSPALTRAAAFALLGGGACGGPGAPRADPQPVSTTTAPPPSKTPEPTPEPVAAVADASADEAQPAKPVIESGAACTRDSDCGWDDPCAPTRCGAKQPAAPGKNCGRPSTPGACRCAGSVCSLVRDEDVRDTPRLSCQSDEDCAFDAQNGRCVAGVAAAISATGIACVCDTLNHWCAQTWNGDVPCKSFRDCSWDHVNGRRTVPAPSWFIRRAKPHPIRPCKDGSRDSVCRESTCAIEAWRC